MGAAGRAPRRFVEEKDRARPGQDGARASSGFEQVTPGTLSAREYDEAVADLVAYLQWMGEPAQNTRVRVGVWVLLFLGLFTVFAWRLNAAYWKDVK